MNKYPNCEQAKISGLNELKQCVAVCVNGKMTFMLSWKYSIESELNTSS